MSLFKRLQQVQDVTEPACLDFSQWSMADLEASKIDFGKQQLGKTYQQVWEEEQRWAIWLNQHYHETSTRMEHQKFVHFVTMKVERAGQTVPVRGLPEPKQCCPAKGEGQESASPRICGGAVSMERCGGSKCLHTDQGGPGTASQMPQEQCLSRRIHWKSESLCPASWSSWNRIMPPSQSRPERK